VTILASPALTAIDAKLPLHEARLKSYCDQFRSVTKLQRDDFLDHTSVSNMMDVKHRTIAAPPENLAGRQTGHTAESDAKRKQDDLERTLRDEPLAERIDGKVLLDEINRKAQAEDNAIDYLKKQRAAEHYRLAVEHCQKLKPTEAKMMQRLYQALADVHSVYSEIHDMRQGLIEDGIGLRGVFLDMPTFLDNPRSKTSELAEYFRRGAAAGFTEVPKAFR
jgi:hypothetical protein